MHGFAACFAIVASVAAQSSKCIGDDTCAAKLEDATDASMMQVRGVNGPVGRGGGRGSVLNSRPFLGSADGVLQGSEEGKLAIDEDGVVHTYYLPGATVINEGKTVKFEPPYRFYLMKRPTTDYSNEEDFYMPNYIGKTFTVDIDFGNDGPACGCNLNFYLVDMPVGFPGKDKDYYCDAQCFAGMGCCAEFDMNEGNMHVQQVTNHACTNDYAGHPDWVCSKWGNPWAKTHPSDFGKGAQHTIDSRKPFTYSQRFEKEGGQFTFTTTISQENREVVLRLGPGNSQMNSMSEEIEKGMAFVTGYWFAPDMNWMDGEECGSGPEHCNSHPAYISNWRITSNDAPVPTPAPLPTPPGPAPTPPGPAPNPPGPAPAPPTEGMCCWGDGCTACTTDATNWCNRDIEACSQCSGTWCPQAR